MPLPSVDLMHPTLVARRLEHCPCHVRAWDAQAVSGDNSTQENPVRIGLSDGPPVDQPLPRSSRPTAGRRSSRRRLDRPSHEPRSLEGAVGRNYRVVSGRKLWTRTPARFSYGVMGAGRRNDSCSAGPIRKRPFLEGGDIVSATHKDIEQRAYQLWQERGSPSGSPDVDWEQAERELSGTRPPDGEAGGMATGVRPAAPRQRAEHNAY